MDEQYYCLRLDDYSAPSFCSFGKAYYGTLVHLRSFINRLEEDEKTRESHSELIAAFRKYEAGDTEVTHTVAFQKVPLLEPVTLVGTQTQRLDNYRWEHLNTWRWPYNMRCDCVESRHYWFAAEGYYARCVVARFENLSYDGVAGSRCMVGDMFWGFPHMIECNGKYVFNMLIVEEKRFKRKKDFLKDKAEFAENRDVDFREFCNDIFGDG